jgi:CubicO group peptidase (beta-lactamase class C family)
MIVRSLCAAALLLLFPIDTLPRQAKSLAADTALVASVDALLTPQASANLLSGDILIARGDRIVVQRVHGFANWELRVPNSPATRFGVGSITKEMTATIVDLLTQEGRLDLNAPVATYLGSFPSGPKRGQPTVRDLLTHRAGVPFRVTTESEETQHLRPIDIVERARKAGLLFEPGTAEYYSSAGFTCLARVIEIIENKPFDVVLADRIFRPASMRSATDETGQQLMPGRAMTYRLGAGPEKVAVASAAYKNLGFLTGAGSVYATAEDVWHFVRAIRSGKLGAPAQKRLMDESETSWRGWYGRTNGYEASMDYLPSADLTVVFLSNLRSAANWQVRQELRSILTGNKPRPIPDPPAVAPPFESPGAIVGAYGDAADPVVISEVDGRLFRDENEFYPMAGRRYYIPASGATFYFGRDASGNVETMVTQRPGGETSQRRVAHPVK